MLIESTIRNIGTPAKCRKLSDSVMSQIAAALDGDYPAENSTYRLGDLVMLFPLKHLPDVLANCDWSIAVSSDTNEPLALFPDITPELADKLRCYLCCTAKAPAIFYHRPTRTVYVAYLHHDWTIGAWFSLAADDFIHADTKI